MRQQFGIRVRELRTERNISLRKFALMIGVNKSHLVDIELGRKSPTLDTVEKIALGLDITLCELFEGIETGTAEYEDK